MKILRIVLYGIGFMLICILPSYAAGDIVEHPNAVYELTDSSGNPISIQFDYLHCKFLNFPAEGDVVKIWYDGQKNNDPDEVGIYTENSTFGKGFFRSDGRTKIFFGQIGADGKDYNWDESTIDLRFSSFKFKNKYDYYIKQNIKVEPVFSSIESLVYIPSSINVEPEDVSIYGGSEERYLSLNLRNKHIAADGRLIYSPFKNGEIINLYLSDGSVKTYSCQDIVSDSGSYYVGFRSDDGDVIEVDIDQPIEGIYLNEGENIVNVRLSNRKDIEPFLLRVYVGTEMSTEKNNLSQPVSMKPPAEKNNISQLVGTGMPTEKNNTSQPVVSESVSVAKSSEIKSVRRTGSRIKLSWKKYSKEKQKKVSRIEIQYSTNKKFNNSKSVFLKKNKTSYTIKKLKKQKTYYIRMRNIRTVNGDRYVSGWSKVKRVK